MTEVVSEGEWFVLRGGDVALARAEDDLGREVVFLPRLTQTVRATRHVKRTETRLVPLYPGYGFLAPLGLRRVDHLSARWGVTLMRHLDGAPVTVQEDELRYARSVVSDDERYQSTPERYQSTAQKIQPGERVVIDLRSIGRWIGTVVSVCGDVAHVAVDSRPMPVNVPAHRLTLASESNQ